MNHVKISLLGFMGAGKSSVGPLLSKRLGTGYIDLDSTLLKQSGFNSIPDVFRAIGEQGFRDLESSIARAVSDSTNIVISTGGGIIGRPENVEALKMHGGKCVLLHTSFSELMRRIPNSSERPLLQDLGRAEALYAQRQPLYQKYADLVVDTTGKTIEEVCSEIITLLD